MRSENQPQVALEKNASRLAMAIGVVLRMPPLKLYAYILPLACIPVLVPLAGAISNDHAAFAGGARRPERLLPNSVGGDDPQAGYDYPLHLPVSFRSETIAGRDVLPNGRMEHRQRRFTKASK